jgi:hypothetical protein
MRKEDCFYLGKIAKNLVSREVLAYWHGWTWVIRKLGISVCWMQQTLGSFLLKTVPYTKRFSSNSFEDEYRKKPMPLLVMTFIYL